MVKMPQTHSQSSHVVIRGVIDQPQSRKGKTGPAVLTEGKVTHNILKTRGSV